MPTSKIWLATLIASWLMFFSCSGVFAQPLSRQIDSLELACHRCPLIFKGTISEIKVAGDNRYELVLESKDWLKGQRDQPISALVFLRDEEPGKVADWIKSKQVFLFFLDQHQNKFWIYDRVGFCHFAIINEQEKSEVGFNYWADFQCQVGTGAKLVAEVKEVLKENLAFEDFEKATKTFGIALNGHQPIGVWSISD